MRFIDRYIAKTVLASMMLVILMLTGLQLFILFVNQLGDLGKADYGIAQALLFIALGMPYQVYLFFPMASLLGCLIGLGVMANHHELVVMRAAGMSIGQVTCVVLKVAIGLIVIATLLGELVLPKLVLLANDRKMQALSAGQTLRTAKGVWLRHHHDFIAIGTVLAGNKIEDVHQFHFDNTFKLQFVRHIDHVNYSHGVWQAQGVNETELVQRGIRVHRRHAMRWDVPLKPRLLNVSMNEPDEMTFYELHQFLAAQNRSHQTAQNYQLVYWQRLVQPLTTIVMMMLAIPFIFGPLRSSTMGSKLLLGATVGFGFYIMNRFFGSLSQIYQFSAIIAAIGPTMFCALLGLYLTRRVR